MHYYKSNNEIMQYCSFSNDIALIMHYRALLKRSDFYRQFIKHEPQHSEEWTNAGIYIYRSTVLFYLRLKN